jgi:hypothetical protein
MLFADCEPQKSEKMSVDTVAPVCIKIRNDGHATNREHRKRTWLSCE